MTTLPITVYGNGDLFREFFNAIAASFGTGDFTTLVRLAVLLSGVTVIGSFISQNNIMMMVKWFGLYYLAIFILFTPKTSVEIIDQVNQGKAYSVDNVPLGLAIMASYTSTIGDALTQLIEMNFTMPDDLRYAHTGMVMASRLVTATSQFEITDSTFDENLQSFIHQCVFYDILLKKYSIDDLMEEKDAWHFIADHASPARAFLYNGVVTTCKDGALSLDHDWSNAIDQAASLYGPRLYASSQNPKATLLKYLPISYGYLTQLSDSANQILQQHLMGNAIERGIIGMGAKLNASAALESYAFTRAQEQTRLTNRTLGDMAAYWLPLMKNTFEAIMYGSFIFVILLAVFPFGLSVLKNYVFTLFWIQIWAPLYAVINLIVSFYASTESSAATQGILSLKAMPGLLQVNADMAGLAGYLTLSVPFLSAGLVKGMAGTFTQIAQYIGGVTQSAGGTAATEAVTGNIGFGNTNFSVHSSNNTSANHFDTSGRVSSGLFTTQMAGGSTLTMTADQSLVMDTKGAISNLGTSTTLANAIRSSASMQADHAETYATSKAHVYSDAASTASRQVTDLSEHVGVGQNKSEGWGLSMNAATAQALNENHRLTEKFAHDHQLTFGKSARVLSSVYGNLRAGLDIGTPVTGVSVGGSIGGNHSAEHGRSSNQQTLYAEAKDFILDSNYSKNIDTVERASHDSNFRASNETGNRLIHQMSVSFDTAKSARDDMTLSFQEAQSYRELASSARENAVSISSNASQPFIEWFAKQTADDGSAIGLQRAENIIKNDPMKASQYAEQFSQQYVKTLIQSPSHHAHNSIQSSLDKSWGNPSQNTLVQRHFNDSNASITHQALSKGLDFNNKIDSSIKNETEHSITQHQNNIALHKSIINQKGDGIKQAIYEEDHHKRSNSLLEDALSNIDVSDKNRNG